MKLIPATLLLLSALPLASLAGTPIPLTEVPEPVNKTIQEYFPGSTPLSAQKDEEAGKSKLEVIVQYKEIKFEVYLSPEGKILEVDSVN